MAGVHCGSAACPRANPSVSCACRATTGCSARRREQKTPACRARYRRRAGVEARSSHLVTVPGARRTPYRGPDKTLGYYAALAAGVNLRRVAAWEAGERPKREHRSCLFRLLAERSAEGALCAAP